MEPTDLTSEIEAAAQQPASFAVDGQSATAQPLGELIKADQYLAKKRVARKRGFWGQVSIAKLTPPAAGGDAC